MLKKVVKPAAAVSVFVFIGGGTLWLYKSQHNDAEKAVDMMKESEFTQYVADYGKSYQTSQEFALRKELWIKTDEYIDTQNSIKNGTSLHGHNIFSDMSDDEKSQYVLSKQEEHST